MKRIAYAARGFKDAERWDIEQNISMTPAQRQKASWQLKTRIFGRRRPDVRASRPR
jgi:hypothetical protein